MNRKSPYHHPVSGHYRQGKWVEKYERGEGNKPRDNALIIKSLKGKKGLNVNVSYYFASGPRETYNVAAQNPTDAITESIPRIQQPMIPIRAQIRRRST